MKVLAWLLIRFFALLPLPVLHGMGSAIGALLWALPNRRKRVALRNVQRCFPELSAEQQASVARQAIAEEMKLFLETPRIWLCSDATMRRYLKGEQGVELIGQAMQQGKGVILLTLHQGQFEQPAICMSERHIFTGLYKAQGKGAGLVMDTASLIGRRRFGGKMLAVAAGMKHAVLPLLAANEGVYFVADQDPPEGRGVFVPFFGHLAHTPILVHTLLKAAPGTPVVVFYGERLPRGQGYKSYYFMAPDAIHDPDPLVSATALNQAMERCVRQQPEQYWWGYQRFRRQPPGAADFYQGTR